MAVRVAWLPAAVPLSNASAHVESEMRSYAEVVPGTRASFEMVPIRSGRFLMGSPSNAPFVGFRVVRPLRVPSVDEAVKYDLDDTEKSLLLEIRRTKLGAASQKNSSASER
jgi:hypothetical protein